MCVSIITDESGVIWLKCNNTVQIWHNPAHPSNCPVEWQSGFNLPITVSDLSSFKILWSPRGMRGACNRICSLHVCRYISRYALAVFFPFCFFFYGGGGVKTLHKPALKQTCEHIYVKLLTLPRLHGGVKFIWLERWEVSVWFILPQISVHRKSEWQGKQGSELVGWR